MKQDRDFETKKKKIEQDKDFNAKQKMVFEILRCLSRYKRCATYGAVAEVLNSKFSGNNIKAVEVAPCYLGERRPMASWIVAQKDKQPTGYCDCQKHPDLYRYSEIIDNGDELKDLCGFN